MIKVAPSILSADFANVGQAVKQMEEYGADYIHCDVMDGMFVPNITFGFPMIRDLKKYTSLPMDVHLMIAEPERYVERFCEAGADLVTVHAESTPHVHRAIQMIRNCGKKPGVVLNPSTPLEQIEYVLDDVDMVLLMSVNPGYGAQKFIPQVLKKIEKLRSLIDQSGREIEIEVDGGVNEYTAREIVAAGANVLVAGNAVFTAKDPAAMIKLLKQA